jgi:trans-2,3-dihydro-3-hydroxyanthranilate isomerase
MATFRYRLVNVFAREPLLGTSAFSGNPLCVFEDASGLGEREMMALTRQFNLSETTFLLPPSNAAVAADARVRIFTPTHDPRLAEMRFAGHPTLGSAHVVRALLGRGDKVTLDLPAGLVPVQASGDVWTLTAPFEGAPVVRREDMPAESVAALVGLKAQDLAGPPVWVDTGIEQFLVPVRTPAQVRKAVPSAAEIDNWPRSRSGRCNAYVFAFSGEVVDGRQEVAARFFIKAPGSGLYEDPGTGSACANLGGWLLHTGHQLPASIRVEQGLEIERPCRLLLDVGGDARVRVGGRVVEVATGTVTLAQPTDQADQA